MKNNQTEKRSDEYYTLFEDVKKIVDYNYLNLKGKNVFCPFDSLDSEFVKYLNTFNDMTIYNKTKEEIIYKNGIKTNLTKEEVYNLNNLIIISNPPFSPLDKILKNYLYDNLFWKKNDFILVAPLTFNNKILWSNLGKKIFYQNIKLEEFIIPSGEIKKVSCNVITSLKEKRIINEKLFKKDAKKVEYLIYNFEKIPYYNLKNGIDENYKDKFFIPINIIKYLYLDYEIIAKVDNAINLKGEIQFVRYLIKKRSIL